MTTTQSVTSQQINALAFLMHELRPDWDTPGCVAALRPLASLPLPQLIYATVRYSTDPKNQTPAAIVYMNNRAWEDDRPWRCDEHPTSPQRIDGSCGACHANRVGEPQDATFRRLPCPAEARDQIVAALTRGKP